MCRHIEPQLGQVPVVVLELELEQAVGKVISQFLV
jgi:hypothetical protein